MAAIEIPTHIEILTPYRAGKPIEEVQRDSRLRRNDHGHRGNDKIVKLASNENPLGPSPKALTAVQLALKNSFRYPDPGAFKLVQTLSQKYKLDPSKIICGSGTDSLLSYMIMAFTLPHHEILTSEGTFIGIYVNTLKQGRTLKKIPLQNYQFDLKGILKQISKNTKIIYLANPNNPTGCMFTKKIFEDFMKKVPPHILVILDEAYELYAASSSDYPNGLNYDFKNLLITRTFSKAYGLAGFRVGWAYGPKNLIFHLYKVKLPFEPGYLAQVAAISALEDKDFLKETKNLNQKSLKMLKNCFQSLQIKILETSANFLLILMESPQKAKQFTQKCLEKGLILRHVEAFGIPRGVRINSGTLEETQFAIEVISKVYPTL